MLRFCFPALHTYTQSGREISLSFVPLSYKIMKLSFSDNFIEMVQEHRLLLRDIHTHTHLHKHTMLRAIPLAPVKHMSNITMYRK